MEQIEKIKEAMHTIWPKVRDAIDSQASTKPGRRRIVEQTLFELERDNRLMTPEEYAALEAAQRWFDDWDYAPNERHLATDRTLYAALQKLQ